MVLEVLSCNNFVDVVRDSKIPRLHTTTLYTDLAILQKLFYVIFWLDLRLSVFWVCLTMDVLVNDLVRGDFMLYGERLVSIVGSYKSCNALNFSP